MSYLFLFLLLTTTAFAKSASPTVIYGEDNRAEPYDRPLWYNHSRAAMAMIDNAKLIASSPQGIAVTGVHRREMDLCRKERFGDQPQMALCSGFLAGPDTLVTAGHCVTDQTSCNNNSWVLDYEMVGGNAPKFLKTENVFRCQSIIHRSYGPGRPDYAVIKLNRASTREPLTLLAESESAKIGDNLVMIGFPSGIPLKITDGGQILQASAIDFVTNLDAFHGNSGSAVLEEKSGHVVGILVSGHADYKPRMSLFGRCNVVEELAMGQGEEKITNIKLVPRKF